MKTSTKQNLSFSAASDNASLRKLNSLCDGLLQQIINLNVFHERAIHAKFSLNLKQFRFSEDKVMLLLSVVI